LSATAPAKPPIILLGKFFMVDVFYDEINSCAEPFLVHQWKCK
jgi:hypothetical protein